MLLNRGTPAADPEDRNMKLIAFPSPQLNQALVQFQPAQAIVEAITRIVDLDTVAAIRDRAQAAHDSAMDAYMQKHGDRHLEFLALFDEAGWTDSRKLCEFFGTRHNSFMDAVRRALEGGRIDADGVGEATYEHDVGFGRKTAAMFRISRREALRIAAYNYADDNNRFADLVLALEVCNLYLQIVAVSTAHIAAKEALVHQHNTLARKMGVEHKAPVLREKYRGAVEENEKLKAEIERLKALA